MVIHTTRLQGYVGFSVRFRSHRPGLDGRMDSTGRVVAAVDDGGMISSRSDRVRRAGLYELGGRQTGGSGTRGERIFMPWLVGTALSIRSP